MYAAGQMSALDSASTSHVMPRSFVDAVRGRPVRIQTASAEGSMQGIGRGDVGSSITSAIIVEDHKLDTPLISVARLDQAGYSITMGGGKAVVQKDDRVIAVAPLQDNLYQIDLMSLAQKMDEHEERERAFVSRDAVPLDTVKLWHDRLGHRSIELLEKYLKEDLIVGMDLPKTSRAEKNSIPVCESCVMTKSIQQRKKSVPHPVVVGVGESISTDLKGPMRVHGNDGEVYYQGVIDRGSKRIFPFFLRNKGSAWTTMTDMLSDPHFKNLKRWHSDGAPELSGKKISDHLASKGVYCSFFSSVFSMGQQSH